MSDWAEKAVAAFFDRYVKLNTPAAHCAYVTWAIPEPDVKVDAKGWKVLVPPLIYPYMWRDFQDGPNGPVTVVRLHNLCR